jgi:spermidine synthase
MTRPWRLVAGADSPEGRLELRQRGEREFVITVGGRVLMNGAASRSEEALARAACAGLAGPAGHRPRVLLGGLGMGLTLRAALDALPPVARVTVAEIDPTIVAWCRGPLAPVHGGALADRRVRVEIADVADVIARAGAPFDARLDARFDAIILDLYEGPRGAAHGADAADPLYGTAALERTRRALAPGGVFAVWSEEPDAAFERRLAAAGFRAERQRPGGGGPRHAVYLARLARAGSGPGRRADGASGTIR